MNELKSLFEYTNYREFLRDYYQFHKARNKNFSYRYFSRLTGVKSPSFLKHVIDGERNLTDDLIARYGQALKLNREERRFFNSLVRLNQARTSEEKELRAREILRCRTYRKLHPLGESQYNFCAHWYYMPIRELVAAESFREEPEWIAKTIHPAITAPEAKKALEHLQKLGLIERNADGRLVQSNAHIATADEVISSSIAQCHRELMKLAADSIDTVAREKRDISSMTIGVTDQTMKKIKEMIQEFRKKIVEVASEGPIPENIYQLNFQFFPMARLGAEEEKK